LFSKPLTSLVALKKKTQATSFLDPTQA